MVLLLLLLLVGPPTKSANGSSKLGSCGCAAGVVCGGPVHQKYNCTSINKDLEKRA